jgi:orotate phosphoribosyltransferase
MTEEVRKIFESSGALLEGHFLLTSGRHSPIYWEKFHVLQNPFYTQKLCHLISQHYQNQGAQVVVGPTTGGIIIAYEVARQLGIRSLFADRGSEGREFRSGSGLDPGTKTLIVDDILTTGKSVREVIQLVERYDGDIIGIGVLVDRSEKDLGLGRPIFSCLRSPSVTYPPENCPLCDRGIPLTRPGGEVIQPSQA